MRKLRVGILGGTGMVGQRFVTMLANHPWFELAIVAASERSAGKTYGEALGGRWTMEEAIPANITDLVVKNVMEIDAIASAVDFVFDAVDIKTPTGGSDKEAVRALEEAYAMRETPVVSAASAHRWTPDVPMIIPEINPEHLSIIPVQRKRLGTRSGFVAVKPNCSIQPYVPALHALAQFRPAKVAVCTYQAISGAGKTFEAWPEMVDNVIPFIGGEEEKSEREPLKIWGQVDGDQIVNADGPEISAQCLRVPVTDGHLAAVSVSFEIKPSIDTMIEAWSGFKGKPEQLKLPSAPIPFMSYFQEQDRPQTKLDRDAGEGMGITLGRLREDNLFDYKFVALSHNTVRGAAGGQILVAELLKAEGYLREK
jgi:aspartate-semialdehyde dehydrogenase